jgi:hypothetical protein
MEEEKLEAQMEYARYEHETEILRERKFCWIFNFCMSLSLHMYHIDMHSGHIHVFLQKIWYFDFLFYHSKNHHSS